MARTFMLLLACLASAASGKYHFNPRQRVLAGFEARAAAASTAPFPSPPETEDDAKKFFQKMVGGFANYKGGTILINKEFRSFFKEYPKQDTDDRPRPKRVVSPVMDRQLTQAWGAADANNDNELTEDEFVIWALNCVRNPACSLFKEFEAVLAKEEEEAVKTEAALEEPEFVEEEVPEDKARKVIEELVLTEFQDLQATSFVTLWNKIKKKIKDELKEETPPRTLGQADEESLHKKVQGAWRIFEAIPPRVQDAENAKIFMAAFSACEALDKVTKDLGKVVGAANKFKFTTKEMRMKSLELEDKLKTAKDAFDKLTGASLDEVNAMLGQLKALNADIQNFQ